jgi:hypothetical protein
MVQSDRSVRRRFGASRRLSLIGIALLVVIVVTAGLTVWDRREEAIAHSRQQLTNLGAVLAEQTARSIRAADRALQETQVMVLSDGADNQERFDRLVRSEEVYRFLRDRVKALPQVGAVELVGADGKLINTSRSWPTPDFDLSELDYYTHLRAKDGPGVFISAPIVSTGSGARSFYLARRIDGSNGDFLGVVLSSIDVHYFEDFYQAINLPDGGSVALFRRDGTMLARYPQVATRIGEKLN